MITATTCTRCRKPVPHVTPLSFGCFCESCLGWLKWLRVQAHALREEREKHGAGYVP